ncbi:MAG: glycosyltransferase, partial [Acidobacteria bacterium]|nr:glycosyltransferase [Acidobacteriota bacterium]
MIVSIIIAAFALLLFGITLSNVLWWPCLRAAVAQDGILRYVSVLIPARNEETNLPACLDAVLAQGELIKEILIYDDHSTDATRTIIERYAARDARIRLVSTQPLAAGWCGKNFACAQLAAAATQPYLLFIDADARLLPNAVARMANEMQRRQLRLLSCWPGLEMHSFAERALMPLLNTVVFSTFPGVLSLLFKTGFPSLGLAHGACLMFERTAYERLGGHAAVKDQIFEDTRLAQLWRARGERALGLDGQDIVRVRMYESFADIWAGFQKNFFPAFQHEASFWLFIAVHLRQQPHHGIADGIYGRNQCFPFVSLAPYKSGDCYPG